MRNITLSADENLIDEARRHALLENTTLNAKFRMWLEDYVGHKRKVERAVATMRDLQGKLRVGRKLTREEMNER